MLVPLLLAAAAPDYPPVSAYLMPMDEEIRLARTAAPANVSRPATIKVLTAEGYRVAEMGTNGFTCMVMRGFTAPTYTPKPFRDLVYDATVRAPICFNPEASRLVMPYYELRTTLGLKRLPPDAMATEIESAYKTGRLPKRSVASFGYMWSAEQNLGGGIGHWHPHMMIFAPNLTNAMLGNTPFVEPVPFVSDDEGTPFSVALVPVDEKLAVGRRAMPGHAQ